MAFIEHKSVIVAFGDRELDLANAALRELAVSPIHELRADALPPRLGKHDKVVDAADAVIEVELYEPDGSVIEFGNGCPSVP